MLNHNNLFAAFTWWQGSCAFNQQMAQQAKDTWTQVSAGTNNYRYYIGSGSRHTMWGSDKVYTDTLGGVPLIVNWINAMLGTNDPAWVNVKASPFNVLLPGDPQPSLPVTVNGGTTGSTSLTITGNVPSGFPTTSGTITSITEVINNVPTTTPVMIAFTRSGGTLTLSSPLPSPATTVTSLTEPFEGSGSDIIVHCP